MSIQIEHFKPSSCHNFIDVDPFNRSYVVSGKVCMTGNDSGNTYGALLLEDILYAPTNQKETYPNGGYIIPTTPKLKYPFTPDAKYTFPSASKIEVFRKYDGTNIFCYRYPNILGGYNITYKTRGMPFLRPDFEAMWRRMLEVYDEIPRLFNMNPDLDGFSFELFGKINHHMIEYPESLDTRLLFARKGHEIVSCSDVDTGNVKIAEKIGQVDGDYVWNYQQHQAELESKLVATDDGYKGDEGYVWYMTVKDTNVLRMFKCKPPTVEKIHWSNRIIPKSIIRTTAQNSLESADWSTNELVKEMLLEDFTETQVDMSLRRVNQIVSEVNTQHKLHVQVKELIKDIDYLNMEMGDVMRQIYTNFTKPQMRHVGSYVKSLRNAGLQI